MVAGTTISEIQCPVCGSREVYHSHHRKRERWLRWLHPGRALYHCHACQHIFWDNATVPVVRNIPDIIDIGKTVPGTPSRSTQPHLTTVLRCPGCSTRKLKIGVWWDDMWTSFRGHNKLYKCRRCKSIFSPPS